MQRTTIQASDSWIYTVKSLQYGFFFDTNFRYDLSVLSIERRFNLIKREARYSFQVLMPFQEDLYPAYRLILSVWPYELRAEDLDIFAIFPNKFNPLDEALPHNIRELPV